MEVRACIEAWNRGDWEGVLDSAAADFEYDLTRAVGPWRGTYGRDQTRALAAELADSWESNSYEVEFVDAGDLVVTPFTNYVRGRDGIEVQARAAWVWTIRDGAITHLCFYQEPEEALEAAGLSE